MFRTLFAIVLASLALHAAAAVDVNRASQAELETVKGIGPGLSTKILEARKAGQFKDWNDMVERVGGVGPGNAARFSQAGLTVGGASYDKAAASERPSKATKGEKADTKAAPKGKAAQPGA